MKREELNQLNRKEYERLMDARRRRQKRYRRFRLFCAFLVATLLCVMMVVIVTVFFKIQTITVTGSTRYTQEQIILTSGIQLEENIFRISSKKISQAIWEAYPYVEEVAVKRHLPNTVEIQITQAQPAIAVENGNQYVYLSRAMRVLEVSTQEPDSNVLLIRGIELKNVSPGQTIQLDAGPNASEEELEEIRTEEMQMEAMGIYMKYGNGEDALPIDLIDVSDVYNMQLIYDNRLIISIGALSDLEYKLKLIAKVIQDDLAADDMGRIRMSGEGRVSFLAENVTEEIARLRAGLPVGSGDTFFEDPLSTQQGENGEEEQDPQEETSSDSDV